MCVWVSLPSEITKWARISQLSAKGSFFFIIILLNNKQTFFKSTIRFGCLSRSVLSFHLKISTLRLWDERKNVQKKWFEKGNSWKYCKAIFVAVLKYVQTKCSSTSQTLARACINWRILLWYLLLSIYKFFQGTRILQFSSLKMS